MLKYLYPSHARIYAHLRWAAYSLSAIREIGDKYYLWLRFGLAGKIYRAVRERLYSDRSVFAGSMRAILAAGISVAIAVIRARINDVPISVRGS